MKNINYKNKSLLIVAIGLLIIIGMTGCKKLVEVDPPVTSITGENVYTNDETAIATLTAIYTKMGSVYGGTFCHRRQKSIITCRIIRG